MSKRKYDINGWAEIKDNNISKVGVFPYSGAQISADLDPDKIYQVYRPEEELADPETIDSFKLLPWTDEHAMLGSEDEGLLAAENKGIHGVIGEDVYYSDGYLKANLKVFSNKLAELIDDGKKELSIGYRCLYDRQSGVYNNQSYDFIQRNIRGNHLASVNEGRSGPDVAVLDHFKCTFDTKGLVMPDNKKEDVKEEQAKDEGEGVMSLEEMSQAIREIRAMMNSKKESEALPVVLDEEGLPKKFVNPANVEDEDKDADKKKEDKKDDEKEEKKEKAAGMDAKSFFVHVSQRNALAEALSAHIGTFDHAEKTLVEVAQYGVKKLGLTCKPGHEESVLAGYLAGAKPSSVSNVAQDSMNESSCISTYLKGSK